MKKLYVAMVGLPARGKSTLAKRICSGLDQQGILSAVYNNGMLRRSMLQTQSASPDFFNPHNPVGLDQRTQIALRNMERAKQWLAGEGHVAIIDATNGTLAQRQRLESVLNDHPILYIECVNEDLLLLDASIQRKTRLPEFAHMTEAEALAGFYKRLSFYEEVYTPVQNERHWIRVDAVDSRILAETPNNDLPHYSAIRDIVSSHWVKHLYLVRHGQTEYNLEGRLGGDPALTLKGQEQAKKLADHFTRVQLPFIFTSTKIRSHMMAAQLLRDRPNCTVMAMPEFDEINAGICETMSYQTIRKTMPEEYAARAANKYAYVYPEGESYSMLTQRVTKGLRRALFIAGEGTFMIIGHQAVNRVILSQFLFQRPENVPYTFIPQNQYYHITISQRKKLFELVSFA